MSDFLHAVKSGDLDSVRRLIAEDPAVTCESENGVSAVLLALYNGKREVATLLVELGAPLSFHDACAAGEKEKAEAMLAENPALLDARSSDGFPPLGLAIFFGNRELAKLLIGRGADVNAAASNPMRVAPVHAAAGVCDHELLEILLERGADPNARQQSDYTPLHTAGARGDRAMAELLLARGGDPAAKGSDGFTVADVARKYGRTEFVEWWEARQS